jgi:predicted dehydrogenase
MTAPDRREFLRSSLGTAGVLALAAELDLAQALFRAPEPLAVGLVGCGRQGRDILEQLGKLGNVTVAAIADPVESRRSSGLRRAQGAVGYSTHGELLAAHPEIQAVIVATPSHLHRGPAVDALAAGRHVYCESPLATTVDDARAIARAARSSGRICATGMLGRVNPIYQLANKFWRSGSIRDAAVLRAQYHKKTSWRTPVRDAADEAALNWRLDPAVSLGLVGELGTHQFDVFHWFLGAYPRTVRGRGGLFLHQDGRTTNDTERCVFGFESGLELEYSATLANSFGGEYELLAGSMGSMKLAWQWGWLFKEADAPTQGWEVYANRQQFHNEEGITLIADATKLAAQDKLKEGVGLPEAPLYYGLENFFQAVTGGGELRCSAEEGLRAAVVAILARQAIDSGEERTIDPSLFEV